MKNIKPQKLILFLIMGILLYPSMVMAVWWNPFSWFKKKQIPPVAIDEKSNIEIVNPIVETKEVEKKKQNIAKPSIQIPAIKTQNPVQLTEPQKTSENTKDNIVLEISNINVVSTHNSAYITWHTNMATESKLLIGGQVYFSKNGINNLHYVDIGLSSATSYNGTITALANNLWANKEITFVTKQAPAPLPLPLQISSISKNCGTTACQVTWATNYPTTASITITKVGATSVSWSFESENRNSGSHSKTLNNLNPNTQYYFTITVVSESDSIQTQSSFRTSDAPQVPTSNGGKGGGGFSASA